MQGCAMKQVPFYRFLIPDKDSDGDYVVCGGRMSREYAAMIFPGAKLIPGTMKLIAHEDDVPMKAYEPGVDPT